MPKKKIPLKTMIKIMLYELAAFNDEGVDLTEETIHNEVLSDNDGFGSATSKNIYRSSIRWVLAKNGYQDVSWPQDWMDWNVNDLAEKLLN